MQFIKKISITGKIHKTIFIFYRDYVRTEKLSEDFKLITTLFSNKIATQNARTKVE